MYPMLASKLSIKLKLTLNFWSPIRLLSMLTQPCANMPGLSVLGVPPRDQLNYIPLPFFLSDKLTDGLIMIRLKVSNEVS